MHHSRETGIGNKNRRKGRSEGQRKKKQVCPQFQLFLNGKCNPLPCPCPCPFPVHHPGPQSKKTTKEVKNPAPYVQHLESKKKMVGGTKETACRWVGCSATQVNGLRFRGSCGLEFWRPFIRRLWYPREEKKWLPAGKCRGPWLGKGRMDAA